MRIMVVMIPIMLLLLTVPVLIGVYVYRDAKRRGMNAALWTLIAVFAPSLIGFIIYLLVRGSYSDLKCPRCDTRVNDTYVVCPRCGAQLRPGCPNCGTAVESDWKVCPKCAQPLPTMQDDVVTPVRPKDKSLWKILVAIILIPLLLIFVAGLSFSAVSSGGSSSLMVLPIDEYYNDQEIPESTKQYVQKWVEGLPEEDNAAYALCYGWDYMDGSDKRDYLYLIYIPNHGCANQSGFGYEQGLFSTAFKLDLVGGSTEDGFYSTAVNAGKKAAPKLKITVDGVKFDVKMEMIDFNPTPYIIASESDYSTLTNAAGDLYVEALEKEMKPDRVTITKVVDNTEVSQVTHSESDFLLNVVVGIHELEHLEEMPATLNGYEYTDYFHIAVHYSDTTGERHYEDQSDYHVITDGERFYLLELTTDQVYPITEKDYIILGSLFDQ